MPELLRRLADGVVEAYEAHIAPDTKTTYEEGWRDFLAFAAELETLGAEAPTLPRGPGDITYLSTLAMWVVWCCKERPVVYVRKDGSVNHRQTGLAWSTVSTRLAGVTKAFAERGVPDPKDNLTFSRILAGLRRQHEAAPKKVTALVVPLLRQVVDTTYGMPAGALRDHALVCLVHARVSSTRLGKLDWDTLEVTEQAWVFKSESAPLVLRPIDDPQLCPVRALAKWRAEGLGGARNGPVFPAIDDLGTIVVRPDGTVRRSSKQALVGRVRVLAAQVGIELTESLTLPDLSDPVLAGRVANACYSTPAILVRDRAVLTVGLAAASRRRNLSEFDVLDAAGSDEGVLLEFRRTKTDPRTVDLREVGGRYCPVVNLRAWLERYREMLGRALEPTDPLFPRIDRHGNVLLDEDGRPIRLERPAFSEIVRRRAEAAGLVGRFRSHSLRRGFASTLAKNKVAIEQIARRGGWKSLDVVWGYIEEARWFEDDWSSVLGLDEG